jgi:hypothetical protein
MGNEIADRLGMRHRPVKTLAGGRETCVTCQPADAAFEEKHLIDRNDEQQAVE